MKGYRSVLFSMMLALSLGSCSSNGVNTLLGSDASLKLTVSLQALVSGTTFTISLKRDGQNLAPPQTLGPFSTLEEALAGVRNGLNFGTVSPGPATLECSPAANDGGSLINFVIQPGENNLTIRCGAPVAAPIITAFDPEEGDVGTEVILIGNNFIDIEAVKFNGIPSEFTVISPTEIRTTVPEGAMTGFISVETLLPNGDLVIGSSDPNPFFIGSEVSIETITRAATEPTNSEEEGTPAIVRITRQGSISDSLVVRYRVGGSAVSGVDYAALSGSVIIPAGSESVDLEIVPLFDGILDPDETVEIILNSSDDYRIGDPGSARVFISDSGTTFPTVIVEATQEVIEEGDEGEFIIQLSDVAREDIEVNFDLGGIATEGVDYELFTTGTLDRSELVDETVVIPSGQSSVRVIVAALEDQPVVSPPPPPPVPPPRESDETLELTLLEGDGYTVGDPDSAEITILNRESESPINQAPRILTTSLPNARVNTSYSTVIQATDPEEENITFSATGLPRGLTLSPDGVLSGTPNNISGFFTVQITARDPSNRSTTVTIPFIVDYLVLVDQPNVIFSSSGISSIPVIATLADGYTPEGGSLAIDIVVTRGSGTIQVSPTTLIFDAGVSQTTFTITRLDPNPFSGTEIDFFTGNSTASNVVLLPAGIGPFVPRPIIRVSGE